MNKLENSLIRDLIILSLREDLEPSGDLSSFLTVDPEQIAYAEIIAKESGIMSCGFLVEEILRLGQEYLLTDFMYGDVFSETSSRVLYKDGESFTKGEVIVKIKGAAILLLALERTILNFLQRLTGISTLTSVLTSVLEGTGTKLLDTRKTSPGMRILEKIAFKDGGGTNHRLNLSDMIMLKENHISLSRFTDIKEALAYCKKEIELKNLKSFKNEKLKIEIEINQENLHLLEAILNEGLADVIMLDNFSEDELSVIMQDIYKVRKSSRSAKKTLIEISGGINPENILGYARLGADFISTSYVSKHTHSLDLSMLISK